MTAMIVTIDGPAGAGKTTVSRRVAARLNCIYVDTGALYRGVAYEIDRQKIDWKNDKTLKRFLSDIELGFSAAGDGMRLISSGTDISSVIRTQKISMLASDVSAHPLVRRALLDIQRNIGRQQSAVFEGRDMGTVVFPHADHKFFLDADLSVRSKRRFDEISEPGADLETVKKQMAQRDSNDSSRREAPLKPAADATIIDSTHLNIDQVVDTILKLISDSVKNGEKFNL